MPETRGEALEKLAWSSIPAGLTAGFYFAGNYDAAVGLGSLLVAAETTGFLVGLGAIGAGLALAAAPALVVGAFAISVGDEKTVALVSNTAEQLSPLISPGVLSLVPIGALVSPHDPLLFAKAVGPAVDLVAGMASPKNVDNLQAAVQAIAGFSGWKSDVINLSSHYSQDQPSVPQGSPDNSTGSEDSSAPGTSEGSVDSWSSGGYPYDFASPGEGDSSTSGASSDDSSDPVGGITSDGHIYINVGPPTYYYDGPGPGTNVASPPESTENNAPDENEDSDAQNQGNPETNSGSSSDSTDSTGSSQGGNDDDDPDDD